MTDEKPVFPVMKGPIAGTPFEGISNASDLVERIADAAGSMLVEDGYVAPVTLLLANDILYTVQFNYEIGLRMMLEYNIAVSAVINTFKPSLLGRVVVVHESAPKDALPAAVNAEPKEYILSTAVSFGDDKSFHSRMTLIGRDGQGNINSLYRNDNYTSKMDEALFDAITKLGGA